jgi:hypothetical protein
MVPSLLNGVYLDGNSQILWEDGERVFCRGWRLGDDGNPSAVLVVLPATERPSPSSLDRLAYEYGLKDELDGLEIFRTVLGPLLEHAVVGRRTDQRNDDPDRILAQHDYRKRVARTRPRAARFLQLDAVRRVTQRRHRNGRAAPIQSPQARHKMDDGFGDMPGAGWSNASSPGYNGSVAFLSAGSFIRRTSWLRATRLPPRPLQTILR